jgi:hypothetical protein
MNFSFSDVNRSGDKQKLFMKISEDIVSSPQIVNHILIEEGAFTENHIEN